MNTKIDYSELISDLKGFTPPEIGVWLSCNAKIDDAIAYTTVFWPQFVEYDGLILFDGFNLEQY